MDEKSTLSTEQRLRLLEKSIQRWKLSWFFLVSVVALFPLIAAKGSGDVKSVRVKSLFVEDDEGRTRISMAVLSDAAVLGFHDRNGNLCSTLNINNDGEFRMDAGKLNITSNKQDSKARISFYDNNKREKLQINSQGLAFWDDNKIRIALTMENNLHPSISLFGNQNNMIKLDAEDDYQRLCFWDNNQKLRAGISLRPNGQPSIVLIDENGDPFWSTTQWKK